MNTKKGLAAFNLKNAKAALSSFSGLTPSNPSDLFSCTEVSNIGFTVDIL